MNSGRGGRFLIDKEEIRPLSHVLIPTYLEWWRTWAGDGNSMFIYHYPRLSPSDELLGGGKKISPIFPATNVDCYSGNWASEQLERLASIHWV